MDMTSLKSATVITALPITSGATTSPSETVARTPNSVFSLYTERGPYHKVPKRLFDTRAGWAV